MKKNKTVAVERAKKALLKALNEVQEEPMMGPVNPAIMGDRCLADLAGLHHERFIAYHVDSQNRVLAMSVEDGIGSRCNVYVRKIFMDALRDDRNTGIILAHNHPGGSLQFSMQDIQLTKKIKEACEILEIRYLDHILVAGDQTLSLGEI